MFVLAAFIVFPLVSKTQNTSTKLEFRSPVLQVTHSSTKDILAWKYIELEGVNSLEVQHSTDGINYTTLAIVYKEIETFTKKSGEKHSSYRIKVVYSDFSYKYIYEAR